MPATGGCHRDSGAGSALEGVLCAHQRDDCHQEGTVSAARMIGVDCWWLCFWGGGLPVDVSLTLFWSVLELLVSAVGDCGAVVGSWGCGGTVTVK